jgi:hypothetical protein
MRSAPAPTSRTPATCPRAARPAPPRIIAPLITYRCQGLAYMSAWRITRPEPYGITSPCVSSEKVVTHANLLTVTPQRVQERAQSGESRLSEFGT